MLNSSLYDEHTFYPQFIHDLLRVEKEVIIESPYITDERIKMLSSILEKLVHHSVKVVVITRDPSEHSETLVQQSEAEIQRFESTGIHTLLYLSLGCPR